MDVSPTPVREALRQLVHERVFERTAPRSVRVAEHGSTTLAEVAELEAHGARTPGFSTEAVHTPARVNVRCVTPLGEEVASIW